MRAITARVISHVPKKLIEKSLSKFCSIFLFYFGGAKGDRTPDLYAASVALSQLSYGPTISVSIITFF